MGATTGISWATSTLNIWRGCLEVSAACDNCYARRLASRNPKILGKWGDSARDSKAVGKSIDEGTRVFAPDKYLRQARKWNEESKLCWRSWVSRGQPDNDDPSRRVFVNSLSDFFEDWKGRMLTVDGEELSVCSGCGKANPQRVDCGGTNLLCERMPRPMTMGDARKVALDLFDECEFLDFLLLTKRPENILKMVTGSKKKMATAHLHSPGEPEANIWHRPNVWFGTTVESQMAADTRVPALLSARSMTPVLFLSCEPLLSAVDLSEIRLSSEVDCNALSGLYRQCFRAGVDHPEGEQLHEGGPSIDWVIAGCEDGKARRPMNLDWARSLRDQCAEAGVPFFMKQLEINGKVLKNVEDFPADLQVQQVPKPILRTVS